MKIELPDEIVEFMQNLAAEMAAQDNRATQLSCPRTRPIPGPSQAIHNSSRR